MKQSHTFLQALMLALKNWFWLSSKTASHSIHRSSPTPPADRDRLVKKLVKLPGIIVCLEATGVYHFDLSLALV
jgi:hypothetical protein